ncbi:hypothetical protein ASZ90_017750 [hydrocarbon metagenome]|uniref:Uncharacterized protein n=1 Tax=hydrocarbon metagenome TaxID=938273 RepID=A0A0W8E8Z4_9ZZZZ
MAYHNYIFPAEITLDLKRIGDLSTEQVKLSPYEMFVPCNSQEKGSLKTPKIDFTQYCF